MNLSFGAVLITEIKCSCYTDCRCPVMLILQYASKSAELFPSPAATALLQTIATAQTGGGRKQAAGPTSGRTASSTTGTRSANTNAKPAEDARKPTPDQSNIVRKVLYMLLKWVYICLILVKLFTKIKPCHRCRNPICWFANVHAELRSF